MNGRTKKTTRISVSLDEADYHDLNQLAGRGDVSVAWVIRRAIAEFLDKHRDAADAQLPLDLQERKVAS